jgi:hypothetical protein
MNVRLHYKFEFPAGLWLDKQLFFNRYELNVYMITNCESGHDQNIALQRMKYVVQQFERSVVIDEDDHETIAKFSDLGIPVVTLPGGPWDQLLEIALSEKFKTVCEDRLLLTDFEMTSELSGDVAYMHSMEEEVGPFEEKGWWHKNDAITYTPHKEDGNVVKFEKSTPWIELGLGFEDELDDEVDFEIDVEYNNNDDNEVEFTRE